MPRLCGNACQKAMRNMDQAKAMRCVISAGIAGGPLVGIAAHVLANVGDPARWKPNIPSPIFSAAFTTLSRAPLILSTNSTRSATPARAALSRFSAARKSAVDHTICGGYNRLARAVRGGTTAEGPLVRQNLGAEQ